MTAKTVRPFFFAVVLFSPLGCSQPDPLDHFKGFQGSWEVVSLEKPGKTLDDAELKQLSVTFNKDRFQMHEKKTTEKKAGGVEHQFHVIEDFIVQLDPSKPSDIQLVYPTGAKQGLTRRGIYVLEGDTLKICFADVGASPASEFAVQPGKNWTLMVFKRKSTP